MSSITRGKHFFSSPPSVKAGFLHDTQELLLVHLSISVPVCFVNHLLHKQSGGNEVRTTQGWGKLNNACGFVLAYLQFFVCEVLSQLFGHPLQVPEGDLACFVVIEQAKRLQDFFF